MDASRLEALRVSMTGGVVDLLLVDPPFGGTDRPSLALHLLQALAREQGVTTKVLYANLLLAAELGEADYEGICYASSGALLGERFFSKTAYGKEASTDGMRTSTTHIRTSKIDADCQRLAFVYQEDSLAQEWCSRVAELIAASGARAVGFTTTFEQTAATVALARAVRELDPDIELLVGGANTEGEMAEGVAELAPFVDFIFSGESERTFTLWCKEFRARLESGDRIERDGPVIVTGEPCQELDGLPCADYTDYYDQIESALPESELLRTGSVWLPFETSRGCWWGQKQHCTFCGINGDGMAFRQKSPAVVLSQLEALTAKHPTNRVMMVDNIMPHTYFAELLPELARREKRLHIFYEQKANIQFKRVRLLKEAGVEVIQPGIEALNSALLRHMRKGVRARQNIALLRYALIHDVFVNWNLLHSFPGDKVEWYQETAAALPFLTHLCPPTGVFGLSIDRFSPYFDQAEQLGVRRVTPVASYFDVLPDEAAVGKLAYHFEGEYESESREAPDVIRELEAAVSRWRASWEGEGDRPVCHVVSLDETHFMLIDTRPDVGSGYKLIGRDEAEFVLTGQAPGDDSPTVAWALEHNLLVAVDDELLPVTTASGEVFQALTQEPATTS